MYRFFTAEGISRKYVFIMPRQTNIFRSVKLCSFCNFYHRNPPKAILYAQIRGVSTKKLVDFSTYVKNREKKNTFVDVTEVSEQSLSNIKTSIKQLSASDVSLLIDQTDIATQLYKFQNLEVKNLSTYTNVHYPTNESVMTEALPFDGSSFLLESSCEALIAQHKPAEENEEELQYIDNEEALQNEFPSNTEVLLSVPDDKKKRARETSKPKPKCIKEKTIALRNEKYTRGHYTNCLLAYIQVCLHCNMTDKALQTLTMFTKKTEGGKQATKLSIKLYNEFMEHHASIGNTQDVMKMYKFIVNHNISPDVQTYATIFEAFGRIAPNEDVEKNLRLILIDMFAKNVSLDDIVNKSILNNEQEAYVLKSIKLLHPTFKPKFELPDMSYSSHLLKNIESSTNRKSHIKGLLTKEQLEELMNIQIKNEGQIEVEVKSVEASKTDMTIVLNSREQLAKLEKMWKKKVTDAFKKNVMALEKKEISNKGQLISLHPFLKVLDEHHYVNAILREIKQVAGGSDAFSLPLYTLYIRLGEYVHNAYITNTRFKGNAIEEVKSVYVKYLDWFLHPEKYPTLYNDRVAWTTFEQEIKKYRVCTSKRHINWPHGVIIDIGKFLYNIILQEVKLPHNMMRSSKVKNAIPAFYTLFRHKEQYLEEQIKPHPVLSKLLRSCKSRILTFDTKFIPSYCPPRPWTSVNDGGYIATKTTFMRVPSYVVDIHKKLDNTPQKQLYPVLDSLNQLGAVPWVINCSVLDVIIEVFQNGGSRELDVPQQLSTASLLQEFSKSIMENKKKMHLARMKAKRAKHEMYCLWCEALYKLSLANHFRDKVFWLPHNLDFRGRVYPLPPHLNHLSADLGRSILLFAKAKPLGPKGLDWLKIHLINLTGFKKSASVENRLEYANENLENIIDSAENPLTGKMWWKTSDNPWQTLAACMEIANALKSPNVEAYKSRFPVHQDGSCNGLQHYAALGRDQLGAQSVNLQPSNAPKDVYNAVCAIVEQLRKKDAKNDVEVAQILEGFIRRKVIKQTVMTTVYGVTKYGARLQIIKQLNDIHNFPQQWTWSASFYLVDKTFESIRTMFTSAREIQDWLTQCARIITAEYGRSVEWVTPLGLPVVQPYKKCRPSSFKIYSKMREIDETPSLMKQKNAFPPNFIHSLDSSHMMLTSLYCDHAGLTFVSVHDCFWTHACTVDKMNRICREQFVALHSEPILENFAAYLHEQYVNKQRTNPNARRNHNVLQTPFPEIPKKGEFKLENVLKSTYFFN